MDKLCEDVYAFCTPVIEESRSVGKSSYYMTSNVTAVVREIMKIDPVYRLGKTPFMQLCVGVPPPLKRISCHRSSAFFECVLIMGNKNLTGKYWLSTGVPGMNINYHRSLAYPLHR